MDPPFDRDRLVEAYTRFDSAHNCGRGESDSPDSGKLGWGEAPFLDAYIKLYEATGQDKWLRKITDHADRIFSSVEDHFGDGHPTWVTASYSVVWARATPMHNRGTADLEIREGRAWISRGGEDVRDTSCVLEFLSASRCRISQMQSRRRVCEFSLPRNRQISAIRPFVFSVKGRAKPGDRFLVETFAARPLEYAVHQGQFAYPIARFIERVVRTRGLEKRYDAKARDYLRAIGAIADKHERDWIDATSAAGAYRFTPHPWERYPNRILPHNQYLAMARAFLVLAEVSRRKLFRDRAQRMARNFKRHLRLVGRAYEWHYWDWVEEEVDGHSAVEDTSHGNIDIGFAVEACRRGVVFTTADMRRFASALIDRMWNGSLQNPVIGGRVNTRVGDSQVFGGWIDLCQWSPKIWEIYWALFCAAGRPEREIPTIFQGWDRLQQGRADRRRSRSGR